MGHKETKMSMKIRALHHINQWGWSKMHRNSGIIKAYRYIFDMPDHVPNSQMKRWIIESTRDIYRFS